MLLSLWYSLFHCANCSVFLSLSSLFLTLFIPICCLQPCLPVSTVCSIAYPTVCTSLFTTVHCLVCSIALFYCLSHCALLLSVTLYVTQSLVLSDPQCLLHSLPLLVLPAFYTAQPTVLPSSLTVCLLFYNINYPTICSPLLTTLYCSVCCIACSIPCFKPLPLSAPQCLLLFPTLSILLPSSPSLLHCKFLYIVPCYIS